MSLFWGSEYAVTAANGEKRTLRLPGSAPSIRKTLEAEGVWPAAQVVRTRTFATGVEGEPVSYFDALCQPLGSPRANLRDSSPRANLRDSSSLT